MPRGNGTGPAGMGPMTGRAAGFCAGYSAPGFANPIGGRGAFGRGGGGRGWRNMYYATGMPGYARYNMGYQAWGQPPAGAASYNPPQPQMTAEQEVEMLKNQAKYMEDDLKAINDRITEIEKAKNEQQNEE